MRVAINFLADLVAVSSTVIPLPVYKVSYALNASPNRKDEKLVKPEGPITLITGKSRAFLGILTRLINCSFLSSAQQEESGSDLQAEAGRKIDSQRSYQELINATIT